MERVCEKLSSFYGDMETREDMSFSELPQSETTEMSHSYHHYPAKFIPQLVRSLLLEFSEDGDYVWDPFCGSGTLNVEALRNNRSSLGSDINPLAILISRAKATPLNPEALAEYKESLYSMIEQSTIRNLRHYLRQGTLNGNHVELRRWFPREHLLELANLLDAIKSSEGRNEYKRFALCCLSSILKRCSYWLSSSVKPQFDMTRQPAKPVGPFMQRFSRMEEANERFYQETSDRDCNTNLIKHDARFRLPRFYRREFDSIITSPPYLISYEYSDIFRLSSHLLFWQEDHHGFRSRFIGTRRRKNTQRRFIDDIIMPVARHDNWKNTMDAPTYSAILNYYADMARFLRNASRHLKSKGRLVLIVGDARARSVLVPNAYVLTEIAGSCGLRFVESFRREISGKKLPTYRDGRTWRFTSANNPNKVEIHAEEYILVFEEGQSDGRNRGT